MPSGRPERTWQDGNETTWQDGNKLNAAGVPGMDEEAGLDDWEPTGAGRKGWYNPQSSSASTASTEAGRADDPQLNPQSGHGDRWRRQESPSVSTGEHLPVDLVQAACMPNLLQIALCIAWHMRVVPANS